MSLLSFYCSQSAAIFYQLGQWNFLSPLPIVSSVCPVPFLLDSFRIDIVRSAAQLLGMLGCRDRFLKDSSAFRSGSANVLFKLKSGKASLELSKPVTSRQYSVLPPLLAENEHKP